ncbi:hypothetical protein [Sinorhizobium meliloti]|uniref:hypothetical protein n=1 Tax=Rhizobium meliloti TaxID=382 RepID=UPI00398CB6E7
MIKRSWIFLGLLALAGCETAAPNFYNGKYYMAGDANCKTMRQYGPDRIMCTDAKGQNTGWRPAMTDQELFVYQSNQMIEAQRSAAINQAIMNQAILNQAMANQPVQHLTPITPPGGTIRCVSSGNYTNCRY